jgi:hypothetical protein
VAPGAAVDPKDMVPVTDLNVKSVIALPGDAVKPGALTLTGVAWSNASPVTKVEISTDAGKTWAEAALSRNATQYGFRRFTYRWNAKEGEYTLISRATNAAGQAQPMEPEWNPSGYLYNAAQPRRVAVTNSPAAAPATPVVSDAGAPPIYKAACFGCHDDHMMRQQRLTRAQWDREVTKMSGWGAEVKPEDRGALIDFLAARFKP